MASNTTAQQVQGFINELEAFLGKFRAWSQEAEELQYQGRPAFA